MNILFQTIHVYDLQDIPLWL